MGLADSPEECIELAQTNGCDLANIDIGGIGQCWCQFLNGEDPVEQPDEPYQNCDVRESRRPPLRRICPA